MNLRKTHVLHRAPALPPGKARALLHISTCVAGSPSPDGTQSLCSGSGSYQGG